MSRHLAVLGSPIEHSKSPALHTAAYRTLQLNWDYTKVELSAIQLGQFLDSLDSDWLGLSLTMPLKTEALRLANEKSDLAIATGVANTLLRTTSGWKAFNTDVFGLKMAISRHLQGELRRVVVLGSGATAASAVFAVAELAPECQVTVLARNLESATQLQQRAKASGITIKVRKLSRARAIIGKADLTISTVPATSLEAFWAKLARNPFFAIRGALLDVVYEPWPTSAVSIWQRKSSTVISGIEMLIWQAIAQIRIFDHNDIDVELPNERAVELAMRHALGLI